MRDDFSPATVETLARRVGYLCSRCRRSTVGPRDGGSASVNIGVGAHITAASPGGPRYDSSLTPEQRRDLGNGVWLCHNCAKLVDNDPVRFSAAALLKLRQRAEERAQAALDSDLLPKQRGPDLYLPSGPTTGSWLAYVAQSTTFCGRSDELAQLDAFLKNDGPFFWWVVAAPGGSGKSRLALELCLNFADEWDSGFLSRADPFTEWASWEPIRPTLIVIDYVAGRGAKVSDAALQLSRSKVLRGDNRVRLLLIERDVIGSWWSEYLRETSFSEGPDIARSQYALPLHLRALDDDALWSVTTEVASFLGAPAQETERDARLAEAKRIDPTRRPLFAMLAAAVPLLGDSDGSPNAVLVTILSRERARWKSLVPADGERERLINLAAYTTILGGIRAAPLATAPPWPNVVAALLPDVVLLDEQRFREVVGDHTNDARLPALQPDIIGEFFVLQRLRGTTGAQVAVHALLDAAWSVDPEAASQFVRRAAADFWHDPSAHLLQEPVARTSQQRAVWSQMIADLVRSAPSSDNSQLQRNLAALRALVAGHPTEARLLENHARAEFNLGTLMLLEKAYSKADSQLSTAIDLPSATPETQADALNNRGIARWMYQSKEAGFADFSTVIEMPDASDEVRACAFNNRADIFFADGNYEASVLDRSRVLDLSDTTHNRRYIALIRRSRAYVWLGEGDKALNDLNSILETDDIVIEQKMTAYLKRASILQYTHSVDARADLDRVIASPVNFVGIVPEALVLRGLLFLRSDDIGRAIQDFNASLLRSDANEADVLGAHMGLGIAYAEVGEDDEARVVLNVVLEHPNAGEQDRLQAQALLDSLGGHGFSADATRRGASDV